MGSPSPGSIGIAEGSARTYPLGYFDPYHSLVETRARRFPFRGSRSTELLPFLSADDLIVLKLSFNRPKHWIDIQAMLDAGIDPDVGYIRE